jgi:hypothetical protein
MISSLMVVLLLLGIVSLVQSRYYCFTGSSEYQLQVVDCADRNSTYTGDWYCATMEVCEQFQDTNRHCISTRGCATDSQCTDSSDQTLMTSPTNIYLTGATKISGMTVKTSCCAANKFEDDDLIAADLSDICNSAPSSSGVGSTLALICIVLALMDLSFL